MKSSAWLLAAVMAAVTSVAGAQDMPPELKVLAAKARIQGTVAAWCRAEFSAGHPGALALAVRDGAEGGRYVAIHPDGRTTVLGSFRNDADLTCYTSAAARDLHVTIKRSATIDGGVTPRWETTVVCGFTENTAAVCWQYSTALKRFVRVGQWTT